MKKLQRSYDWERVIKIIARVIAGLFLLLSLYYIIWSIVRKDDFSSIVVYSGAIAISMIAIENLLLNRGRFIVYCILAVTLFILGILNVNLIAVFQ